MEQGGYVPAMVQDDKILSMGDHGSSSSLRVKAVMVCIWQENPNSSRILDIAMVLLIKCVFTIDW